MSALALVPVPVCGETLRAGRDDAGAVWVSIPHVAEVLGIDSQRQTQKLRATAWAGVSVLFTPSPGGSQATSCLPLRAFPMWLATVHASKVRPEARAKLERFQCEAADVLARHFLGEAAAPSTGPVVWADDTAEQLADLRGQVESLRCVLHEVNVRHSARISALEAGHEEVRRAIVAPAVQLALPLMAPKDGGRYAPLVDAFERLVRGADVESLLAREVVEYARAGIPSAVEILKFAGIDGLTNGPARELGKALAKASGVDVGGKRLVGQRAHDNVTKWRVDSGSVQ